MQWRWKPSITKEKRSENTFSVKFWKVSETTKYGKVVPDGRNVLEELHLITFVQDVLIWMTYINCILKLTVLSTEINVKLPGAGKGFGAFSLIASTVGIELTSLFVILWRKISGSSIRCKNVCILKAASRPLAYLGHQFFCPLSYQDNSHLPRPTWQVGWPGPNALQISVMGWEREGILDRYEGSSSYNLIHIQQGPSALAPRYFTKCIVQRCVTETAQATLLSSSRQAGCTRPLQTSWKSQTKHWGSHWKGNFRFYPGFPHTAVI